jgi:hypothetical protein
VRIAGNLDAAAMVLWPIVPFSPEEPWTTAAFSTTFTAFDDLGRSQTVSIYFGRREHGWDYHAVLDGTVFVIGEGHLSFDDQGVVTVDVHHELRLLTASGPGQPVELDLSGMTQLAGPMTINEQEVDGRQARWGTSCAASASPESTAADPRCAAIATTRIALRANLAAASPSADEPSASLAPTSAFTLALQANDAQGALLDFELDWRKTTAETWDYQVLLAGDQPGPEVASGTLSFNPNGSLRSATTTRQLRFPNHDGVLGEPIELDFGAGTAAGGNGVDGVTSFNGASFAVSDQSNGALLGCLPTASSPLPEWRSPSCSGEHTTAVTLGFNLDPRTPVGDAVVYAANATLYDAALTPQQLELRFEHVEASRWRCRVLASASEVGVVDLLFNSNGAPSLVENIPTLRLPLPDGSAGPPIHLAFDAEWVITSFAAETQGWLAPNGAAPGTQGCVE